MREVSDGHGASKLIVGLLEGINSWAIRGNGLER